MEVTMQFMHSPRNRVATLAAVTLVFAGCGGSAPGEGAAESMAGAQSRQSGQQTALAARGRHLFRYETFGDEAKWTDTLRMHEVVATAVDPATALSVGLKVDVDALPPSLVQALRRGSVDLHSPATTVALLKLDAVVGLKGTVERIAGEDRLTRLGVTCALCHSTVDDSFAPGIGKRLDGWPNRQLNPGAIIALSPALDARTRAIYASWGAGRYDPRFNVDGRAKPVVIPPAYGLAGIHRITFTGDGDDIAYWNRYVAVTQMGGLGVFTETRFEPDVVVVNGSIDLVSDKLPALQAYQLSLAAPAAPAGSFDPAAAARGRLVFEGQGGCVTCHTGPTFTDANTRLHPPSDSMAEPETPSYAARSATRMYRTSPLKGVWQHPPYFHDGSAATLEDVVRTYDAKRSLGLSPQQIGDLAQYLKSL
jgi:mono/diheme cytochrome c family protein